MTLKEFLKENDLLRYVEHCSEIRSSLNRVHIDRYRKIENGFEFHSGKSMYQVKIERSPYDNRYTYFGEKAKFYPTTDGRMLGMYFHIPCLTGAQERTYPMSVAWIGTALANRAISEEEMKGMG